MYNRGKTAFNLHIKTEGSLLSEKASHVKQLKKETGYNLNEDGKTHRAFPRVLLTVGTAVDFDSEPDAALSVPVQGHHAHVAGDHRVLQVMPHHAVGVDVPGKCLGGKWDSQIRGRGEIPLK